MCDEVGNGQQLDWMASAHSSNFNHCYRCKVSGLYWLHFWTGQGGWDTSATFKSLWETIQWHKILTISLCEKSCRISPSVPDMVSVNHGNLLKFKAIFFCLGLKKNLYSIFQTKTTQIMSNKDKPTSFADQNLSSLFYSHHISWKRVPCLHSIRQSSMARPRVQPKFAQQANVPFFLSLEWWACIASPSIKS